MILYINDPKHSTQKTLRNSFRKVAVYKINSHLWWLTMVEYAKESRKIRSSRSVIATQN